MDFSRTVRAVLLTGTWGSRDTATPGMFSAAHCLKRGSLFGPLMGKLWNYLEAHYRLFLDRATGRRMDRPGVAPQISISDG